MSPEISFLMGGKTSRSQDNFSSLDEDENRNAEIPFTGGDRTEFVESAPAPRILKPRNHEEWLSNCQKLGLKPWTQEDFDFPIDHIKDYSLVMPTKRYKHQYCQYCHCSLDSTTQVHKRADFGYIQVYCNEAKCQMSAQVCRHLYMARNLIALPQSNYLSDYLVVRIKGRLYPVSRYTLSYYCLKISSRNPRIQVHLTDSGRTCQIVMDLKDLLDLNTTTADSRQALMDQIQPHVSHIYPEKVRSQFKSMYDSYRCKVSFDRPKVEPKFDHP